SRPTTTTRCPLRSDSAACSARSRHKVQVRNSGSPSLYSLAVRSNTRGVEATVNFAIAVPAGVNRRSGSAVRLPITVTVVSLLIPSTPSHLVVHSGRRIWRPPRRPGRTWAAWKQSASRRSCGKLPSGQWADRAGPGTQAGGVGGDRGTVLIGQIG